MIKEFKIGKYRIESIDQNGRFFAKVFNMNAKKPWNAQLHYYSFRTSERRDEWIKEFTLDAKAREDYKAEQKAKRLNFENPAKVGDILYSSWGYDQTNIDFYQVVAVNGKQITIREIAQERKETEWLQGDCLPVPGRFLKDSVEIKKFPRPGYGSEYSVNLTSYSSAWLWDGKVKHYTAYA